MIDDRRPICPCCGSSVWRDSVDVGIGVMHGPYGCECGWSEDPHYDRRSGDSEGQREHPEHHVDQWGGLSPSLKTLEGVAKEKFTSVTVHEPEPDS